MTPDHSPVPVVPVVPDSIERELQALYREAADDEPAAALDNIILKAARAELAAVRPTKVRPQAPWWRHWLTVAASTLAVALIGLSITWRVMDEQERQQREQMNAAETAPAINAPAPTSAPASAPTPAPAPSAAIASEQKEKSAKSNQRDVVDEARARRDAGAVAEPPIAPAPQQNKAELDGFGAAPRAETATGTLSSRSVAPPSPPSVTSSAPARAAPLVNFSAKSAETTGDAATPEAWLKHIRELQAAGRNAAAAQSLARFRVRYPDVLLPDDLLNLR